MEHLDALVDPKGNSYPKSVQTLCLKTVENVFLPGSFLGVVHVYQVSFHDISIHSLLFLFKGKQSLIDVGLYITVLTKGVIEEIGLEHSFFVRWLKIFFLEPQDLLLVFVHHFSRILLAESLRASFLR